jgi:hypothetical protein
MKNYKFDDDTWKQIQYHNECGGGWNHILSFLFCYHRLAFLLWHGGKSLEAFLMYEIPKPIYKFSRYFKSINRFSRVKLNNSSWNSRKGSTSFSIAFQSRE